MAVPVVVPNTPDAASFNTLNPSLEFTGTDADGDRLTYDVEVQSNTYNPGKGLSGSNSYTTVAYGAGVFVALGTHANIAHSTDGKTWVESPFPYLNVQDLIYADGRFVAVRSHSGQSAITSVDGYNWTLSDTPFGSTMHRVAFGNGMFVGLRTGSGSSGRVFTSPDGLTWTNRATAYPDSTTFSFVTYGQGKFVIGRYNLMESVDGITWTDKGTITSGFDIVALAYGNGQWAGVSNSLGTRSLIVRATEIGPSWTGTSDNINSSISYADIKFSNGFFYGTVRSSTVRSFLKSKDGVNWDNKSTLGVIPENISGVIYAKNNIVIASSLMRSVHLSIAKSSEDIGFSNLSDPSDEDPFRSGDQIAYELTSSLIPGSYSWSVRAMDPEGSGTWGEWSTSREFTVIRPPNPGIFMQFLT